MRKECAAPWLSRRGVLGGYLQGAPLGLKRRVAACLHRGEELEGSLLTGATMPSGHKCEDRLKGRREDRARRDVLKTAVKRWRLSEIA